MQHDATTFTMPLETPVGRLVLESDGDVLIGIWLPNRARGSRGGTGHDAPPVLKDTATQLEEYFARERTEFDIPMELKGTAFQKEVWAELSRIPYGEDHQLRRAGPTGGSAQGTAGRGAGKREKSHPHHRPLPSRRGQQWHRGLRRRSPLKRSLLALEGVTA